MARNMYGATSADFTLTAGGRIVPGATLTIWSERTGGTQITDLLDRDSVAVTTVTSAADGSVVYYGPDGDNELHWADSGQGSRVAIRPVDITVEPPTLTVGTVDSGTAAVAITGDSPDYTIDFTLPPVGTDGVDTAAIQDDAVTADKIAADAVATAAIQDDAVTSRKMLADRWPFARVPVINPQMVTTNVPLAKGGTYFMPFRATEDAVVTGIRMVSNAVTTGATSIRFGLYHIAPGVAGPRGFALVARTDPDTGIFASVDTAYTRSFSAAGGYPSAVRLVSGQHYAVAYQVFGGTPGSVVGPPSYRYTAPSVVGIASCRTAVAIEPPPEGFYGFIPAGSIPSSYNTGFYAELVVDFASALARPPRTVIIGDSVAEAYGEWIYTANGTAGAPLLMYRNAAVGGSKVTDATTSVASAVVPFEPDVAIVHSGVNDIAIGGTTTATMQTRYTALFDALDAAGVGTIVACTPPPSTYITGAGQESVLTAVRSWMLGLSRPNLVVADTGIAMSTGDGVTSDAAKRADGVHPNATGLAALAAAFADVLIAEF